MPATNERLVELPGYDIKYCPACKWRKTESKGRFGEKGTKGYELVLCKECHERLNGFKRVCSLCGGHEFHGGYEETSGGSWEPTGPCSHCKGTGYEP
jgi:RNA polymerase subunit RPABC4/transcription elongation factor Spt4